MRHTLVAADPAPLLLPPPKTSFPEGLWAPPGGVPVGLCALLVVVADGTVVDGVVDGIEPVEALPGLPSSRLPVPVKALNFGSSGSGGAASASINKRNKWEPQQGSTKWARSPALLTQRRTYIGAHPKAYKMLKII